MIKAGWAVNTAAFAESYLRINELNDVDMASQLLQKGNLINEACSRLTILSLQLYPLQGTDLAIGRHDLEKGEGL